MTEFKINIVPIVVGIFTTLASGILIWIIKEWSATLKNNTHSIIELTAKFDIFKERTDDIPDIKKNLNVAHQRINELEKGMK